MSALEIYIVQGNGDVTYHDRARNSFGGAMHIWRTLEDQFHTGSTIMDFAPLWKAIRTLPERERWVLAFTFDRVIVAREWVPTLLTHLKSWTYEYPTSTLLQTLDAIEAAMVDPTILGVCFNMTSVCSGVWDSDRLNPETEEYAPYNVNQDDRHWWLTPDEIAYEH